MKATYSNDLVMIHVSYVSHEWMWKSFPNPLMGEHKLVIHNRGILCTIVFAVCDLRIPDCERMSTSNCQIVVIVTIYNVVKSYVGG